MAMTHEDFVEWASGLAPQLADRAREAERLRRLPDTTIADVDAVDGFALVTPERRGGHGLGLESLTEVARLLAHGCVSTGWTVSFLMLHNWFVARGSAALQDAVWGEHSHARIPCPLAPTGAATPVDGGYRLTGRWQWATGVMHADWVPSETWSILTRASGATPRQPVALFSCNLFVCFTLLDRLNRFK